MTYYLNAQAFRVVQSNDRGIVTYRKRYKKGDEVDVGPIDPAHLANLVRDGHLVDSEEDLTEPEDVGNISPSTGPVGAAVPIAPPEPEAKVEAEDKAPGSEDEHDVDEYDAMDYSELQGEAKSRSLSAGGSAEEIRGRLREDDASEA